MRLIFAAAIILAAPALLLAQTAQPATATAQLASAKPAAPKPRVPIKQPAARAVEEVTAIDDDPNVKLTAEDMEIAKRVYVGTIPCELGASITITPSDKRPGLFLVQTRTARFHMHPVESRTGAIRLEDPRAGAMWLQLGNKSMLMSQKLGQRLADECMSPAQVAVADDLKKNPLPSILDAPVPMVVQAAPTQADTGAARPSMPSE